MYCLIGLIVGLLPSWLALYPRACVRGYPRDVTNNNNTEKKNYKNLILIDLSISICLKLTLIHEGLILGRGNLAFVMFWYMVCRIRVHGWLDRC